jgi:hypothetical protein
MRKTYLTDSTILFVHDFHNDEKIYLGKMLTGIVYSDQTYRFVAGQRVITSTIQSSEYLEFTTKSGDCYISHDKPENFELRISEFVVMRHLLLSPDEVLEAREKIECEDAKKLH